MSDFIDDLSVQHDEASKSSKFSGIMTFNDYVLHSWTFICCPLCYPCIFRNLDPLIVRLGIMYILVYITTIVIDLFLFNLFTGGSEFWAYLAIAMLFMWIATFSLYYYKKAYESNPTIV
jgi:hypothetical protein